MTWLWRSLLGLLSLAIVVGVLGWLYGPREPVDREISYDPSALPEDLDAHLSDAESAVDALRDGAQKRIVWAGEPGVPTPISIVYVHGFSAAAEEIRPVPDDFAKALGANLFFTRLAGHGRDGPAMAEASAGDWVEDMAEAMAIGRRLGDEVIVIGTSTGGTLAALAAHDSQLSQGLAGVVFVSPNFAVNNAATPLLTAPWARDWVPELIGEDRSWTPINEGQAAHWTSAYPTVAIIPMAALVAHVRELDHADVQVPAIFVYSEHDQVILPGAVRQMHDEWGGPKEMHALVMNPGDDPYSHVIAGDILSPGQTEAVVDLLTDWARDLP